MSLYPAEMMIEPWSGPPPVASVRVPGSKSLTNRALAIAAMAAGSSTLSGALHSEDTRVMIEALQALGIEIDHDATTAQIRIEGCSGRIPARQASLYVANSGTSLRFLTAMLATATGTYHLDGAPRMRQRPVDDLLAALRQLGVSARSDLDTGCPPVTIEARGLRGGYCNVRGDASSQFLSGLLMASPHAEDTVTIEIQGVLVSQPYVAMTLAAMEAFGVKVGNRKFRRFDVYPSSYRGRTFTIEPDASAASYFFALAALTGGTVTIPGLGTTSLQGDLAFVDILEHMGCNVHRQGDRTTVTGRRLRAVDVDMNAMSDTVMTMAVVALFANGVSRIRNVGHIRLKESDRIAALAAELRKLGAKVDELPDGLVIEPPDAAMPGSARIDTYDDHRMAMSFALAGLKVHGITILNPGCVAKTYPGFWKDLEEMRSSRGESGTEG
jgi:3-phosphoshikimate 1-carboxyvinyltransferase